MNKLMIAARAASVVVCIGMNVNAARAQSVPSPWTARDVGSRAVAGSSTLSDSVFEIDAAGSIGGRRDDFHFVYQAVSGDVDIRARVDTLTQADGWSKAGVMIRAGLSGNSAHGYALVSAGEGIAFQRRQSRRGLSTQTAGGNGQAPNWVRLVRAGTTVTAYASTDGSEWTVIGSDSIALGTTAYLGLAVSSHSARERISASISQVALTSSALPAGQAASDVGTPAIQGHAAFSGGTYTIAAAGEGIWDRVDQFHYVYQPVTGDLDVVARVASITKEHPWSKAGVMIRESLAPDSSHAMALASAGNGCAFHRRTDTGVSSEHTSGGSGTPPGWVRLVRTGTHFEAFRSANGTTWTSMGTASIAMGADVLVGLAVTSQNVSAPTTAVIDGLRITEPASATNRPPSVILTSPAAGASFVAPATLTLTASASDSDGSVAGVAFYANSTLLGRATSAPYTISVGSVPQGTYSLTAEASDNLGASAVSASVGISVSAGTSSPAPSTVAFTASADHATLVNKYVLEVYKSGAIPGSSTPVATSDLARPTPDSTGTVTVDRSAFFQALAQGDYIAAVVAVGSGGSSRSQPASFTR